MGCSCHISPPCSYCMGLYECIKCGKTFNEDEDEPTSTIEGDLICPECSEKEEAVKIGNKRFCLVQDDCSQWYLIPHELKDEFISLCESASQNDDYDFFNDKFLDHRIDGPHRLSFENPRED